MAEGLAVLGGEQIDLDGTEAVFAAAMAAPPADKPGMAAPPRKPPMPDPDPETAPHGWTFDGGEWRPKKAPGRQAKAASDRPRVVAAPTSPAPKTAEKPGEKPPKDYRKTLLETAEGLWFAMAATPIPDVLLGKKLGRIRTRVRVQAALIQNHADRLAAGVNTIAANNKFVARALDRLAAGEGGLWVLPTCLMLAPFISATAELWSGGFGDEAQLEEIATQTELDAEAYIQSLAEAVGKQAAAA